MLLVMWNWGGFAQRDFVTQPLAARYPQQSTWVDALPLNEFAAIPQRPQSTPA
jgi:hypothetical protein